MPVAGWLVLMCVIAGVPQGAVLAAERQPHGSSNQLQAVDYSLLPAGGVLVRLTFAEPAQASPNVLVNHYPIHRITFDFADTVSVAGKRLIEVGPRGLRTIQLVQSGTRMRVILNLDRPFIFETILRGTELIITLRRPNWGVARGAGKWTDEIAFGAPRHGLCEIGFECGAFGEGRIFVRTSPRATGRLVVSAHRRSDLPRRVRT